MRHGQQAGLTGVPFPGNPDIRAGEQSAEEMEPVVEAGDMSLFFFQDEVQLLYLASSNGNRVHRRLAITRKHQKVVGIADQFHPGVLQRQIEVLQIEVS